MIEGAFAKDRVVALLRDFVFYPDDSPKNEAIFCKYPQIFGAKKLIDNIKLPLRPAGGGLRKNIHDVVPGSFDNTKR